MRVSEPISRQVGMQVPYSLCSQVSEESSLWPNPAEDWKNLSSLLSAKEVGLIEGHAMPDHVHMVLSIPPQHSVSSVLDYLKGKSAIMIHREMERVKHGFTGKHFWAKCDLNIKTCGMPDSSIQLVPSINFDHLK